MLRDLVFIPSVTGSLLWECPGREEEDPTRNVKSVFLV